MTAQIMTAARDTAETAAEKANVYGLLAAVFRRELDAGLLRALRAPTLRAALAGAGVAFDHDFLEGPVALVLESHAVAYTALFIGPGEHVPPYASIHIGAGPGGLWGPATVWAKAFIEDTGFGYLSEFHDLPDHVSVELEFMQNLWARESEALTDGDTKTAALCRERRKTFLAGHLGRWLPFFCERVAASAEVPFYAEIAKLTMAVVSAESAQPAGTRKGLSIPTRSVA